MSVGLLYGQFQGEDELGVLAHGGEVGAGVVSGDWYRVGANIVHGSHAMGYMTAGLSWIIGGNSVFALRLPHLLMWVVTVAVGTAMAIRLAGWPAGVLAGGWLAGSGIWGIEGLAVGHAGATMSVMLLLGAMLWRPNWTLHSALDRRWFITESIFVAGAFLWFNSMVPVVVAFYAVSIWYNLPRRAGRDAWRAWWHITAWFGAGYLIYGLIFLGVPYMWWQLGYVAGPIGQLGHYLGRSSDVGWQLDTWRANLRLLNWYHLPILWTVIMAAGVAWLYVRKRALWWIVVAYGLAIWFGVKSDSEQHFLSFFIWTVPFGAVAIWQAVSSWSSWRRWAGVATLTGSMVGLFAFTYVGHVRWYAEKDYPDELIEAVKGGVYWRHNEIRPLLVIAGDLQKRLGADEKYTVTIDGALPLYYWPDPRFVPGDQALARSSTGCFRFVESSLVTYVAASEKKPMCDGQVDILTTYENSYLYLARRR